MSMVCVLVAAIFESSIASSVAAERLDQPTHSPEDASLFDTLFLDHSAEKPVYRFLVHLRNW